MNKLSQTFFLSANDTNAQAEMSLPVLTSKIIDIATAHANSLGIGNPAMESLGYGWVLSRLAVEMMCYPKVNETYTVSTWIESWNRHFSVRNFKVEDAEGNPCGYASSVWMVLNWKTRENAGTSHLVLNEDDILGESVPIARQGKHRPIVSESGDMHGGALLATAPPVLKKFGYADLDFYRHVNTVRYVSMLVDCFTLSQMEETQIARLELAFMREGRYGENVCLLRADENLHTSFALSDAEGGTGLLSAAVVRRPRIFS